MPRLRKCGRLPSLQRRISVALLTPVIRAISLGGTGCSSPCRRSRTVLIPAATAGVNEGSTSPGDGSTTFRRFRRFVSTAPLGRPRLRGCSVACIMAILMSSGSRVNSTNVMNVPPQNPASLGSLTHNRLESCRQSFHRISYQRSTTSFYSRRIKLSSILNAMTLAAISATSLKTPQLRGPSTGALVIGTQA
jgi:hypothetical protein